MTDLEMTKLCAEAMGLRQTIHADPRTPAPRDPAILVLDQSSYELFDPLHNDAQAMAMVKALRLSLEAPEPPAITYWTVYPISDPDNIKHHDDLNRAIVECVAKATRVP